MPNMTSTPRDSSERTSDCAPVTDSGATTLAVAGATAALLAGAGCGRTPAATVSGDGEAVACLGGLGLSGGDLVIASMPSTQGSRWSVARGVLSCGWLCECRCGLLGVS